MAFSLSMEQETKHLQGSRIDGGIRRYHERLLNRSMSAPETVMTNLPSTQEKISAKGSECLWSRLAADGLGVWEADAEAAVVFSA